jgi:hypothetical protein
VGEVLALTVRRIDRDLRRRGLLRPADEEPADDPEARLAADLRGLSRRLLP